MLSILTILLALFTLATAELFHLQTSLPGDHELNYKVINAEGRHFYTNLTGPASYCPENIKPHCPNATEGGTLFNTMNSLWVQVPGGQKTYVEKGGALGFTQAHSADVPAGAYLGGWTNVTLTSACDPALSVFNWQSPDKKNNGIYACPRKEFFTNDHKPDARHDARHDGKGRDEKGHNEKAPDGYQIFAKTADFKEKDCVKLVGLAPHHMPDNTPFAAWQFS